MPEEWASIRSMARCVLPVFVGPSTAVTPAPRTRASRSAGEEKEMAITFPGLSRAHLYHYATVEKLVFKLWNESRTNRARIADSPPVRIRSLRYVEREHRDPTRSGGERVLLPFSLRAKP